MKIIKLLATIIIFFIILSVGLLGYAGIIPGVSALFGANKPRDLDARHTAQDLVAGQTKLQQAFVKTDGLTVKNILNAGSTTVKTDLSAAEWAAHIEAIHPVKDLQVKFNADGTFEVAGRIDKDRIFDAVRLLGYTNISEAEVLGQVEKYLPGNAVIYLKGRGNMVNDRAEVALDRFEIGRLSIGQGLVQKALQTYADTMAKNVPGLSLNAMKIIDGQLHIEGTVPKQVPQFENSKSQIPNSK